MRALRRIESGDGQAVPAQGRHTRPQPDLETTPTYCPGIVEFGRIRPRNVPPVTPREGPT
jgi:hypothetical protein